MIEYLDEDEKFRRIDEALAKTLERFERQGILRSEIREGLWTTANRFFSGDPAAENFIRDQIDAWSLSLIKRQGVPQSVVGAELLRKGLNLLAQAAGPAEAVRHMTKLAEDLASNVLQQKS